VQEAKFLRSEIQTRTVELKYVPTDEKVTDIFTKPVTKTKLEKFKALIMKKVVVRMSYAHDIRASGGVRYVL